MSTAAEKRALAREIAKQNAEQEQRESVWGKKYFEATKEEERRENLAMARMREIEIQSAIGLDIIVDDEGDGDD